MSPIHFPAFARCVFALLLSMGVLACGRVGAPPDTPTDALPPYDAVAAQLFDDALGGAVLDPSLGKRNRSWQRFIQDLTRSSDGVLRVRVSTLSRAGDANLSHGTNSITVRQTGEPLAGSAIEAPLELSTAAGTTGFRQIERLAGDLVGRTLIVFYKRYSYAGAERVAWHAEPSTEEIAKLVQLTSAFTKQDRTP